MSVRITEIEQALRENLESVTKGPWRPGHLANDDHSCDCGFVFDSQDRMGSIATVNMDDGSKFGNEYPSRDEAKANLKHIVAAQPENIRALLDELSRLRTALEPFAMHGHIWRDARTDVSDPVLIRANYADNGQTSAPDITIKTMQDAARTLSEREGHAE